MVSISVSRSSLTNASKNKTVTKAPKRVPSCNSHELGAHFLRTAAPPRSRSATRMRESAATARPFSLDITESKQSVKTIVHTQHQQIREEEEEHLLPLQATPRVSV